MRRSNAYALRDFPSKDPPWNHGAFAASIPATRSESWSTFLHRLDPSAGDYLAHVPRSPGKGPHHLRAAGAPRGGGDVDGAAPVVLLGQVLEVLLDGAQADDARLSFAGVHALAELAAGVLAQSTSDD